MSKFRDKVEKALQERFESLQENQGYDAIIYLNRAKASLKETTEKYKEVIKNEEQYFKEVENAKTREDLDRVLNARMRRKDKIMEKHGHFE